MIKSHLKNSLVFFLITAFVSVSWLSVHIHMGNQHEHNGSHHQHQTLSHAHNSASHHEDVIDAAYQVNEHEVVEIDGEYLSPCFKKSDNNLFVSISTSYQLLFFPETTLLEPISFKDNPQPFYYYSIAQPRAPPRFS